MRNSTASNGKVPVWWTFTTSCSVLLHPGAQAVLPEMLARSEGQQQECSKFPVREQRLLVPGGHAVAKLDRRRSNPVPANRISQQLRRIRQEQGLSQADCAAAVQSELYRLYPSMAFVIDQSDISRMETGERPVWDYELLAMAKALSVSVDLLFGAADHGDDSNSLA